MRSPEEILENTVQRCRERDIIIPTYREMAEPTLTPLGIRQELAEIGLWDLHSRNLKYFTWVEQQGKTVEELDAQWYDDDYWTSHFHAWEEWDRQIIDFNERTGVLGRYR